MTHYRRESNSREFAHSYFTEEYGQIVVMLKTIGEGLGVDLFFHPPDMGICSLSMTFGTDPEDVNTVGFAHKFFTQCDEHEAVKIVRTAMHGMQVELQQRDAQQARH